MIDRPDIAKKINSRDILPITVGKGDVQVKVNESPNQPHKMMGFHMGPRYPGDVFYMARRKDGSLPKGSWFKVLGQPDETTNAEDMA